VSGLVAGRRGARARYEVRVGTRELVVLGLASLVIAGLVFTAGVLVGREAGRGATLRVPDEAPRESPRPGAAGLRPEPPVKPATLAEERFTFYRTLTAPTPDLPPVGKPRVEERMVPREEPPPAPTGEAVREPVRPGPGPAARPAPPSRPEPPVPARAAGPPRAARGLPPPAPPPRPVPPPGVTAPASATPAAVEAEPWTVQVSAFRSRTLAEELRTRLAARGFDAYLLTSASEDGRARYRVRVGAYPTRSEAERIAAELRSERGLNPIVTSRAR
jgi:cell division protein FtsN